MPAAQTDMYNRCLEQHGREARWIAFLDMDEFLFSPTRRPLSEVLTAYEQRAGRGRQLGDVRYLGARTSRPGS